MMRRTHLSADLYDQFLYWVVAKPGAHGPQVVSFGRVERGTEGFDALPVAPSEGGERMPIGPVRVALDTPSMTLRRENLPAMKTSEAGQIARRRSEDILEASEEEACFGWLHGTSDRPAPLWLCAAPASAAREAHELWSRRGVDVRLLCSRQLALGNIVRALADPIEPGLTAILDLDEDRGTCVLADRDGWVFGREFPLRDFSDLGREGDADSEGEGSEDSSDVTEMMLEIWAMRLATELRRTFRYVDGELALGRVTRICVAGSSQRIAEICPLLANRLEMEAIELALALGDGSAKGLPNGAVVALGLALWPNDSGGNLLPAGLLRQRAHSAARRRLLVVCAGVTAAWFLAAAGFTLESRSLKSQLLALQKSFDATGEDRALADEQEQTRLRGMQLEDAIARIDRPLPALSGLLSALGRVTPDEVHVERLRVARVPEGFTLQLEVEANAESVVEAARAVSILANALKSTPLLVLDSVVQDEVPVVGGAPGTRAHIRFRLDGWLAPVASTEHGDATTGGAPRSEAVPTSKLLSIGDLDG